MTLRFAWDAARAASNWSKHHVKFETAARVFADPFAFSDRIGSKVANCVGRPLARSKASWSFWLRTPPVT